LRCDKTIELEKMSGISNEDSENIDDLNEKLSNIEFLVGEKKLKVPKGFPTKYNILNDKYFAKTFKDNSYIKN
jgi:hypothetical protein